MLEKIHYGIATLCGVVMVVAMLGSNSPIEGFPWVAILAGVYLVSKALLIGKKK